MVSLPAKVARRGGPVEAIGAGLDLPAPAEHAGEDPQSVRLGEEPFLRELPRDRAQRRAALHGEVERQARGFQGAQREGDRQSRERGRGDEGAEQESATAPRHRPPRPGAARAA